MVNDKINNSPTIRLKYKKSDLIIKEGDYGISIYKIVEGKVLIFNESKDREIPLATLDRGEVVGEMTFLSRITERRSASVRALEDTEVEVWDPSRLSKEYEHMPPIIRYIADQALKRLIRMNKLLIKLYTKKQREEEERALGEPLESRRIYYRKEVDLHCIYRPVGSSPTAGLTGRIKDISFRGVGLEVRPKSTLKFSHEIGEEFHLKAFLPNGKEVDFRAKVLAIRKDRSPGRPFLGMSFTDTTDDAKKNLGFFLMP